MTEFLRPDADGAIGNWTGEDGRTTNLYTSINESTLNLANYIQSGINPTNDKVRIRYGNPAGLITSGKVRYTYGKKNNNSTVVNQRTQLVQGASTIIASWDHADIPYTPTTVAQDLTGPQLTSITDFTDLWIEHIANPASAGPGLGAKAWDYWEPNVLAGVYQTEDTSTPVTVADGTQRIGRIEGKLNGNAFIQPVSGSRPYLATGGYIDWGDGQYFLYIQYPTISNTTRIGAGAVFNAKSGGTNEQMFLTWSNGAQSYGAYEGYDSANLLSVYYNDPYLKGRKNSADVGFIQTTLNTRHRAISIWSGTTHRLNQDGGAFTTPVASTLVLPSGNFGATAGQSAHLVWGGDKTGFSAYGPGFWGKAGALVLINDDLTSGEEATLDAYLAAWNP